MSLISTSVHLRAEGQGKAMVIVLTPAQPHEATVFEALLEQGTVRQSGGDDRSVAHGG